MDKMFAFGGILPDIIDNSKIHIKGGVTSPLYFLLLAFDL
jgi:hypothetical protein